MDEAAVDRAAARLADAWRARERFDRLPDDCRPATLRDALRVQARMAERLGEPTAGWKVGAPIDGELAYGIIVRSRFLPSGSTVPAAEVPLLGMEAEIAFRFVRSAPPRAAPYSYAEIAERVEAFVALEIVASRYCDYRGTPLIERIADLMSSGALVAGAKPFAWEARDPATLTAELWLDDRCVVRQSGGHAAGDPLLPAVALANVLRHGAGVPAGRVMTTGTFTGLVFAQPGQRVRAAFDGLGDAHAFLAP